VAVTVRHGIVAVVPAAVKTSLTELGDSRVRLQVEVPAGEVEGRLERKARELGRDLKLPGFRRGKVPAPLVLQRVGREAVLEQAVRETLPSWYSAAIATAGIVPVGDPQLDLGELPGKGQALEFSIEIGVLPKAELGQYKELEVPRREPLVTDEQVDREIDQLRERLARLETVERAAEEGDFVVVDYVGSMRAGEGEDGELEPFAGGEGRDQLIELGGGNLIPGFEEGLVGAGAGETRTVEVTFPADYGNRDLASHAASFEVSVKDVKRKELPQLDDDFAVDAGFDDLEDLRQDVRRRLGEVEQGRIESEFREAALDAAVDQAEVATTPELIGARAQEMWERMLHSLGHRGITREAYLRVVGREEQDILAEMQPEAERALRREAVITAVVAAEDIEPSDQELLDALADSRNQSNQSDGEVDPQALLEQLREAGRLEEVREDLAARQAIDVIAGSAKPIAMAQAQAREQLWTPEKAAAEERKEQGQSEPPARLWTPDR
jgi:trigger factor